MKTSWISFFRNVASACCLAGATAWSSAVCYAAQLAFDVATNAPYADGWQAGDNGGFGLTPWNFDNDTLFHVEGIRAMDGPPAQSQFNQLGTAWRLGLNYLDEGRDIVRAGRGLAAPLAVGQTLSIVIDPPADMVGFRGYYINLNSGGGSVCYGGEPCTPGTEAVNRFRLQVFNWIEVENWGRWGETGVGNTSIFNVDKLPDEHPEFPDGAPGADDGLRVDFTLTSSDGFDLTLTPLDNPQAAFMGSGALEGETTEPLDWIEFTHWMKESDPAANTDFYIRSIEVTGPGSAATADFDNDGDADGADFLQWQRGLGLTTGATRGQGDSDSDGDVDATDLANWKSRFGTAGAVAAASAVPEPGGAALLVAGILGLRALRGNSRGSR